MDAKRFIGADDTVLVEACKKGDLAAYEQLLQRYQRMLFNTAFRITGVYEDAGDIVQDSLISAWRKIGDFRGDAKISTWLTAIVVNNSRNRLQQRQQRERVEIYSLDAPIPAGDGARPDPPAGTPSALAQLEIAEMHGFLKHCVDALSQEFREVLVLRDMQEIPYIEVAAALQIREGTVKSRLFRAREAVRDCLKKAVGTS